MNRDIFGSLESSFVGLWGDVRSFLPEVILAFVVVIVGWIFGGFLKHVVERIFTKLKINEAQEILCDAEKRQKYDSDSESRQQEAQKNRPTEDSSSGINRVESISEDSSSSDDDEDESKDEEIEALHVKAETLVTLLASLHHKIIDISLRLAEHHLRNYWSSSAMQALRTLG